MKRVGNFPAEKEISNNNKYEKWERIRGVFAMTRYRNPQFTYLIYTAETRSLSARKRPMKRVICTETRHHTESQRVFSSYVFVVNITVYTVNTEITTQK